MSLSRFVLGFAFGPLVSSCILHLRCVSDWGSHGPEPSNDHVVSIFCRVDGICPISNVAEALADMWSDSDRALAVVG